MTVDTVVSRQIVKTELALAKPLVNTYGWVIEEDLEHLLFRVRLRSSADKEEYIMEFACDNYKEMPPFIEFIDPITNARGVPSAYPKNGNGFFHSTPCICAQFNRKAYQPYGGPHNDWAMQNWEQLRPHFSYLGDMIHLVQRQINNPNSYHGRMAPLKVS